MKKKSLLLSLLLSLNFICLLLSSIYPASANELKIRKVLDTGGENNYITQDKDGLLWISIWSKGLYCYDGNELKKIKIIENENLVPIIWSVFVDREDIIWFLIQDHGLYSYDKNTGICKKYKSEPGNPNSLTSDNINWLPENITEDKDGLIWVGTADGLNSFDKKTGKFTQYKHNPDNPNSISNNCIWVVFVDSKGLIWIGTEDGLNCYNKETGNFSCYKNQSGNSNISDNCIYAIAEDKEGNLWIGTKNTGIDKFDKKKNIFKNYRHDPDNSNSLSHNEIHHIMVDRFDNLWICNEGRDGIDRYNIKTDIFKHYGYDSKDPNSISSNSILYSFEDNTGIIWLADESGDINKCTWQQDIFKNYSYDPKDSYSIGSNNICKLYEDKRGNIWVGTYRAYRGGLSLYTKDGKFENFKPIATNDSVFSILGAPYDKLWLGDNDRGSISLFDTMSKKVIKNYKNPYELTIWCLIQDNKYSNIIWFACNYAGSLFKFDTTTGKFTQYKHIPGNINSVSNENTSSIFQDRDILWIGTGGGGLTKFDKTKGSCVHYKHDPNDKNSISGNIVIEPYIDNKGNFWVTTEDGGLNKFDKETEKFTSYGIECGFPSKCTRHILEDNDGFLWISTDSGIVKFAPQKSKVVKLFTKADGLLSNQFDREANALRDSKGNFWFSTMKGLCKFNPEDADKIQRNPHIPPVVLASFKSKEGTYNENGLKKLTEVKLPWPDNTFEFTFAALDYTDPSKNQYAYKLEGFDKNWNYIGANRFGQYANLSPGEYILYLKGANSDSLWNEEGISIKITITPPFWMTLWFKALIGIAVLCTLGGMILLIIRSLKKKAIHMRDHAIAKVTAQVTHDIRSPLAALDTALKDLKEFPEEKRILIRNAIHRISDIANNLLMRYRLKGKENTKEQKHLNTELVSSILNHLISEKRDQITEKSIDLVLELGNNTHSCFVNLEPGKFKRVISNLINNAFEAIESKGIIRVALSKETDSELTIKIIDNGKGIPENILLKIKQGGVSVGKKEGHGIGISGAIQNIKSWNGSYDIQSKIGEGTTFIIKLPIADTPEWFQNGLDIVSGMKVIILDDDQSIHDVWETRFQEYIQNKQIVLAHFYTPSTFIEYCKNLSSVKTLFLIDYELLGFDESGLDLIEKLNLKDHAILVTSRYEEPTVRDKIAKLRIKAIPKNFAPYIPITYKT